MFCRCTWVQRNHSTSINSQLYFIEYIFSKGGFTEALLEQGRLGAVTLLTLDDIYR